MTWWSYVERVAKTTRQRDIAERVGIDPSNVTRWKSGPPRAENVAAFARAYGRPVVEAFVAAGFLTAAEARMPAEAFLGPGDLTDAQLLDELRRRLLDSSPEPPQRPPASDSVVDRAVAPSDAAVRQGQRSTAGCGVWW